MHPFAVRDAITPLAVELPHIPGPVCPACVTGYPRPCPRITGQGVKSLGYDDAGQSLGQAWQRTYCPGTTHAELGVGGVLETRCAACGMPP